jgi:hypothetical protein
MLHPSWGSMWDMLNLRSHNFLESPCCSVMYQPWSRSNTCKICPCSHPAQVLGQQIMIWLFSITGLNFLQINYTCIWPQIKNEHYDPVDFAFFFLLGDLLYKPGLFANLAEPPSISSSHYQARAKHLWSHPCNSAGCHVQILQPVWQILHHTTIVMYENAWIRGMQSMVPGAPLPSPTTCAERRHITCLIRSHYLTERTSNHTQYFVYGALVVELPLYAPLLTKWPQCALPSCSWSLSTPLYQGLFPFLLHTVQKTVRIGESNEDGLIAGGNSVGPPCFLTFDLPAIDVLSMCTCSTVMRCVS